jgi:hypothetical protein
VPIVKVWWVSILRSFLRLMRRPTGKTFIGKFRASMSGSNMFRCEHGPSIVAEVDDLA